MKGLKEIFRPRQSFFDRQFRRGTLPPTPMGRRRKIFLQYRCKECQVSRTGRSSHAYAAMRRAKDPGYPRCKNE